VTHRSTCSPTKLQQILINLLANAVKVTPPGGRIALELLAEPFVQVGVR
jgi:signal transduction histidine kinase